MILAAVFWPLRRLQLKQMRSAVSLGLGKRDHLGDHVFSFARSSGDLSVKTLAEERLCFGVAGTLVFFVASARTELPLPREPMVDGVGTLELRCSPSNPGVRLVVEEGAMLYFRRTSSLPFIVCGGAI